MSSSPPTQVVIRCDTSSFKKVRDFIRQRAVEAGFNRTDVGRLVLAVDEVCSNIVKHSYHFEPNHKLTLSWHERPESAVVEIEDDSPIPYLPSPADFDLPTKIKYRHTNGYGKYLIRKVVDDVQFETVPGSHNKVSLIKFRAGHAPTKKEWVMNPYEIARARSLSLLTLFEVGETLSHQQSVEGLMKVFLYAVMGRLTTQPVALLAPLTPVAPFVVVGQNGLSSRIAVSELAFPRHGWIVETLWAQRGPFLADEFHKLKIPAEELENLDHLQSALLVPLFVLNRMLGILSLGPKRTRQAFSEEDVNLMTLLGTHVLLLMETMHRGADQLGGVPARPGGEIRAAVRATMARLAKACRECNITMELPEGPPLPKLKLDAELLNKLVLTLLTHLLYLTHEGEVISIQLAATADQVILTVAYPGTPLGFERGKSGYNPLIDQMIGGSLKLSECRKVAQAGGGSIEVHAQGEKVSLTLSFPLAS